MYKIYENSSKMFHILKNRIKVNFDYYQELQNGWNQKLGNVGTFCMRIYLVHKVALI